MAIPPKQIGQSTEANLLWNISNQIDNLKKTSNITDPALLSKIDELIALNSELELSAETINLNTNDLENLILVGNALLEEIKNNTSSGISFDGQLVQTGNLVSEENPLPVKYVNPVFYTENVEEDTSNNTTFVGKQTNVGVWLLQKIVEITVGTKTTTTMEYASVLNNAAKTTYAGAWTDRATLTYSEIKDLL